MLNVFVTITDGMAIAVAVAGWVRVAVLSPAMGLEAETLRQHEAVEVYV